MMITTLEGAMKIEMTKKNIAAAQLSDRRFQQRRVKDKTKYTRKNKHKGEW